MRWGALAMVGCAWASVACGGSSSEGSADAAPFADATSQGDANLVADAAIQGDANTVVDAAASDAMVPPLVDGGNLVWATRAGGAASDAPTGLGVLADGSWLVAGRYSSTAPGFGEGEAGGAADVNPARIATVPGGSTLIAGLFSGEATFGPGEPGGATLSAESYSSDMFAALLGP